MIDINHVSAIISDIEKHLSNGIICYNSISENVLMIVNIRGEKLILMIANDVIIVIHDILMNEPVFEMNGVVFCHNYNVYNY